VRKSKYEFWCREFIIVKSELLFSNQMDHIKKNIVMEDHSTKNIKYINILMNKGIWLSADVEKEDQESD
jgi:hypothetical protein